MSNFRQTCLIATSPSVENEEKSSFWELGREILSHSTFSWVGADIIEEQRKCHGRSFESLIKPRRPTGVYMLVYNET